MDFLLELRCEEIPARMQAKARADLQTLFEKQLAGAGLAAAGITVYSTPRRLALIAHDLPEATEPVSEEAKGPPEGAPDQAIDGFCRKQGIERGDLEIRDVKGRPTYFAVINRPGRAATELLAEAIPAIIRAFPWPKSQRWGATSVSTESLRWVRPLSGIVALLGNDIVDFEIGGIASGRETLGHRFMGDSPAEPVTINNAAEYAEKLRGGFVIVDHEERETIIREGAAKAAADIGLVLVEDEGLVIENAGLTEWPVPLLGRFDQSFLDVPPEVIQLTARVNQKYFVVNDAKDALTNAFVCTANIDASDGGAAIVAGNEKVLAARLADAKFFWELDQKTTLAQHAKKLTNIVFHEKLGTVADKVERIAKLARWLCDEGIVDGDAALAEQAARLCKADLVTEMVGEFPDLQGLMGGYYAEKEGLEPEVAAAIRDHYKPVGQGDDVPTAPVTVAVSLADKLDTLVGFFQIDEKPTGSKDPFALRRAGLGILALILSNGLRVTMRSLITAAAHEGGSPDAGRDIAGFLIDRLKVQQRDAGLRHDMIDAVLSVERDADTVRVINGVAALQKFVATDDGANLFAGYKRAANILKQAGEEKSSPVTPAKAGVQKTENAELDSRLRGNDDREEQESALLSALEAAEPKAAAAIEAEQFEDAMSALASLRAPIDSFFDNVMVNDEDAEKRAFRLGLLARFRDAVHAAADFSKIEG